MVEDVNVRRGYDSSGRQEQAQQRRRAALASALALITSVGYAGMTMPKVAREAGVSTEFLYKTFGDKPSLVKHLVDATLVGDDEPVPMAQRPAIRRMLAEPDAGRTMDLYAVQITEVNERAAALLVALAEAARGDPRLAEVWDRYRQQRLAGSRAVAADLAGKTALPVPLEHAADIIWTLNSPELYQLMVDQRGWSLADFTGWVAQTLRSSLLSAG
jgi:AcrR family transcriptional regulator